MSTPTPTTNEENEPTQTSEETTQEQAQGTATQPAASEQAQASESEQGTGSAENGAGSEATADGTAAESNEEQASESDKSEKQENAEESNEASEQPSTETKDNKESTQEQAQESGEEQATQEACFPKLPVATPVNGECNLDGYEKIEVKVGENKVGVVCVASTVVEKESDGTVKIKDPDTGDVIAVIKPDGTIEIVNQKCADVKDGLISIAKNNVVEESTGKPKSDENVAQKSEEEQGSQKPATGTSGDATSGATTGNESGATPSTSTNEKEGEKEEVSEGPIPEPDCKEPDVSLPKDGKCPDGYVKVNVKGVDVCVPKESVEKVGDKVVIKDDCGSPVATVQPDGTIQPGTSPRANDFVEKLSKVVDGVKTATVQTTTTASHEHETNVEKKTVVEVAGKTVQVDEKIDLNAKIYVVDAKTGKEVISVPIYLVAGFILLLVILLVVALAK